LASLAALREMVLNLHSVPGIDRCPASRRNQQKRLKEKSLGELLPHFGLWPLNGHSYFQYFFLLNSTIYSSQSPPALPPHSIPYSRSSEMSFKPSLEQTLSETDRINTEIAKKLVSERQLRANRANAQKSTGPKTEAGKQRSRLNGMRHGITGQVSIMTDENRTAHKAFCDPIIKRLAPDGPLEMQIAHLIA